MLTGFNIRHPEPNFDAEVNVIRLSTVSPVRPHGRRTIRDNEAAPTATFRPIYTATHAL